MAGALDDQEQVMSVVVDIMSSSPFEWGRDKSDCCSASLKCFRSVTGVDILSSLPPYDNESSAESLILSYGSLESMCESLSAQHGLIEVFHPGCLGLTKFNTLSIGIRPDLWAARTLRGVRFLRTSCRSWGCENFYLPLRPSLPLS